MTMHEHEDIRAGRRRLLLAGAALGGLGLAGCAAKKAAINRTCSSL